MHVARALIRHQQIKQGDTQHLCVTGLLCVMPGDAWWHTHVDTDSPTIPHTHYTPASLLMCGLRRTPHTLRVTDQRCLLACAGTRAGWPRCLGHVCVFRRQEGEAVPVCTVGWGRVLREPPRCWSRPGQACVRRSTGWHRSHADQCACKCAHDSSPDRPPMPMSVTLLRGCPCAASFVPRFRMPPRLPLTHSHVRVCVCVCVRVRVRVRVIFFSLPQGGISEGTSCAFFLAKKKRFCRRDRVAGQEFCGNHADAASSSPDTLLLDAGTSFSTSSSSFSTSSSSFSTSSSSGQVRVDLLVGPGLSSGPIFHPYYC